MRTVVFHLVVGDLRFLYQHDAQTSRVNANTTRKHNRSRSTTSYNETYFVLPNIGVAAILVCDLKQSNVYSIKQPSDF